MEMPPGNKSTGFSEKERMRNKLNAIFCFIFGPKSVPSPQ
jgi:hypothetical protein